MASACVNNIPTTYSTSHTSWFSTRTSLSRDYTTNDEESSKSDLESSSSSNNNNAGDFNFQLGTNTVAMLPADELFSDGKLLPLHLSTPKQQQPPSHLPSQSPDDAKVSVPPQKEVVEKTSENPYLFSPKAPRCSSRWKELLGLKKPAVTPTPTSTTATTTSSSGKSIRQLLNRNSKTTAANSLMSLPLLRDSSSSSSSSLFSVPEQDPSNVHSSRLSLSSSSSSSHDELPRLSLDLEKPKPNSQPKRSLSTGPKVRPLGPGTRKKDTTATTSTVAAAAKVSRGVTIESPRMNPSGRVVFESLERSSSCPSSFNGGLKYKNNYNKGLMERSYSGNVVNPRITPVLNVPVCSLRGSSKFGFGHLFSSSSQSQKKEGNFNGGNSYVKNYNQHTNSKIKDKIKESS